MSQRKDWIAVLLLVLLVLATFWRATTGGVFYFGDIYQLHYPLRSAYARDLTNLTLPLWTTDVLAGYPLLAEGQLGALYPPNLLLHLTLPVPIALNVFVLVHFCLAAVGTFLFVRRLRVQHMAAIGAGVVYALGGFLVAHLNHINILACAAWLPWLFLLTDCLLTATSTRHLTRDTIWLAALLGLEFLAGHVQIALLSFLAMLAYGFYLIWVVRPGWKVLARFGLALFLGVCLAAAQLLPSYELTQLSARAGGLDPSFFTSFSLHPLYLVSLLTPFVLGNPYPNTSVEMVSYVGLLPLMASILAVFVKRRGADAVLRPVKRTGFFVALAIGAVFLALGRWNPVYMALLRLPVFNLFRVPARYLYLFSFSMAVLTGLGLDAVLGRAQGQGRKADGQHDWIIVALVAAGVLWATEHLPSVDALVGLWQWLPVALLGVAFAWIAIALSGKASRRALAVFSLVFIVADLLSFNAVYSRTYNQTMSIAQFTATPRSLSFLQSQSTQGRIFTSQEITPVLPVMRESYFPNLSLINGLPSANGDFPLVLTRFASYLKEMTPRMLDLLGVQYYLIPQVLPIDEPSEFYDLEDRFALNPVGRSISIPATQTVMLEIESYLGHSVDYPDGKPVAEIRLRGAQGESELFTLRAGWHTAEWAYDRSDVSVVVRHAQPQVARSWPARSGFPPEDHKGYTYVAQFRLQNPMAVKTVEVRPLVPMAYIRIERMSLIDSAGTGHLLTHLANMADHTLVYRSEDVAIYENHDALPRVFVLHKARAVHEDDETLRILSGTDFDPRAEVLLAAEQVLPEQTVPESGEQAELLSQDSRRVNVRVRAVADGYLVLTDTWYPGWRAFVDGQEVPILRADLVFRAVTVAAGEHTVEFVYTPASFQVGLWVSLTALFGLAAVWAWGRFAGAKVA